MTRDEELMQQALDALEGALDYTNSPSWSPSMTKECLAVALALRERLAQRDVTKMVPDKLTPDGHYGPSHHYADGWNDAIDAMTEDKP